MIKRVAVLVALCCLGFPAALAAKRRAVSPVPPVIGGPLPGLSPSLLARFDAGRQEFDKQQTPNDGLGPLLNNLKSL